MADSDAISGWQDDIYLYLYSLHEREAFLYLVILVWRVILVWMPRWHLPLPLLFTWKRSLSVSSDTSVESDTSVDAKVTSTSTSTLYMKKKSFSISTLLIEVCYIRERLLVWHYGWYWYECGYKDEFLQNLIQRQRQILQRMLEKLRQTVWVSRY